MSKYIVTVGFWLRAFDSDEIEAGSDIEAVEKARDVALAIMNARTPPAEVDLESRCAGVIAYVDRVTPDGRKAVVEDFAFHHANSAPPRT